MPPGGYISKEFNLYRYRYSLRLWLDNMYLIQTNAHFDLYKGSTLVYTSETLNIRIDTEHPTEPFDVTDDGLYTLIITNDGPDWLDVKEVCWVYNMAIPTSTPAPATVTGTPSPGPYGMTPVWLSTGTPASLTTSTPEPPQQEGFCDTSAPPGFPPDDGLCGQQLSWDPPELDWLNWWQYLLYVLNYFLSAIMQWLCKVASLVPRLFKWLGWVLQWVFCPVVDIIGWARCALFSLAAIVSDVICALGWHVELLRGVWEGFWGVA